MADMAPMTRYAGGKGMAKAHPGFKAVATRIAKRIKPRAGETAKEAAGAILASAARNASAGAKRANPRLKRVRG